MEEPVPTMVATVVPMVSNSGKLRPASKKSSPSFCLLDTAQPSQIKNNTYTVNAIKKAWLFMGFLVLFM